MSSGAEPWPGATRTLVLITCAFAAGAVTILLAPEAYYRLVQEDGPLEWCTFWALALAGVLHFPRPARRVP